ncbi:MAG: hypothetical protein AB1798_12815 [Spirochaetota bacterium]
MEKQNKFNFNDLYSDDPKIKYGSAKGFINLAEESPAEIYPYLDNFIGLLKHENKILRWTAIDVIGSVLRLRNR